MADTRMDDVNLYDGDVVEPDMPPEITSSPDGVIGAAIDQLMESGFDNERDDADILASKAPTGDWVKEDSWELQIRYNGQDSMLGDMSASGRLLILLHGKPAPRAANGIEYQPMLFFRLSPDRRYKAEDTTKTDMAYKLYLRAKEAYVSLYSESPRTWRQLLTMLKEDSYVLRTMNGDNGPVVVDVKPKRPGF